MNKKTKEYSDDYLPVMEQFYSIQGEGLNTGKAAWFVRISGCDVGCSFCDIKESWNPDLFPPIHIDAIIEGALSVNAKAVVLTGGEPMLNNLDKLTSKLKMNGIEIFLETSGNEKFSGTFDWICLSPKSGTVIESIWFEKADEMKIIIEKEADFNFAESLRVKVRPQCNLLLQPEWSVSKNILPEIIVYIKNHPYWRLSLQAHKYINIP